MIPAEHFFLGPFETDRQADEILTEIVIPTVSFPEPSAYLKLKHAASSWPIVTASCVLTGNSDVRIRLCLGGVGPIPTTKEWSFSGELSADRIAAMAKETVAQITNQWADELAGFNYRKTAAAVLGERVLRTVVGVTK